MSVKPVPDGYHTITPYLFVKGAAGAMEFYKKAFGAEELLRFPGQDGKVGHAELKIGNSVVMLADEYPEMGFKSPTTLGGPGFSMLVYVENVDVAFKQAIAAGATEIRPVKDEFYGDRVGTLKDPFGHIWSIATHKEDVTPEEMHRRAAAQKV